MAIRVRLTLNCKICGEPVLHQDVSNTTTLGVPTIQRTKAGLYRFMGRLIRETVKCPGCHMPVIKLDGVLNRGVHGSITMTSIPSTNTPKEPKSNAQ